MVFISLQQILNRGMQNIKIIVIFFVCVVIAGCGGDKKQENFRYFTNYSRTFSDLNDRHLASARKWGITPVRNSDDLKKLKGRLEEVKSCRLYEVDELTHSKPYLVSRAHDLLKRIAKDFKDSLDSRGLPSYTIIVTSVLRTNESVKNLRKRNLNASANSAHIFGTTFDIAYGRFKQDSFRETEGDKLKSVLADVLSDLRKQKQCYVRYEYKQGCFHITVR